MAKPKKRIGLQKDFSTIFDGVWIPQKPRQEEANADHTDNDRDNAPPTQTQNKQDVGIDTPTQSEQDQPLDTPTPDRQDPAPDTQNPNEQDQAFDTPTADGQRYAVDTPAQHEQDQAFDSPTFQAYKREIEEIISSMKCSKGFACYESKFQNLCKIRNIGEGKIIECSPENKGSCVYRFTFMGKIFCKCPLRYYIARNLNM